VGFIRQIWRDKLASLSLFIIVVTFGAGICAPVLAPHDPEEVDMALRYAPSSWEYLLGNDHLGRDILSRLLYGIRPSVLWVFAALLLSVASGAVMGFLAGYYRGRTDTVVMRICDVMLSFPGYVTALAVVGILGAGFEHILLAFVLMKWAWFARIIRTSVMQHSESDYVKFAKALGVSDVRIMAKHLLPVSLPDIAVIASSAFGSMIMQISGLSFLGLGVQAPDAEWGMMLSEAREVMFSRPELMLAPGLATVIVVTAVNFLSDALQTALDPKLMTARTKRQGMAGAPAAEMQGREVA
jgi:nickel transport system permease protein